MRTSFRTPLLVLALPLLPACALFSSDEGSYERPLVAVIPFESRVSLPLPWQLGPGVADVLTDSLFRSGAFQVLERGDLDHLMREQELQNSGWTRQEQRIDPGKLKNVRYLVKGVVTDFSHVSTTGLGVGFGSFRIGAGGELAVVGIALRMTDVESGEILFSRVVEGEVFAGSLDVRGIYEGISFGGSQFFETPLGRALADALDEAVESMTEVAAREPWHPTVVDVDGDHVVINGGHDRGVRTGSRWKVYGEGGAVVDPVSGDVLGHRDGDDLGTVMVVQVMERHAVARVLDRGDFVRGHPLRALPEDGEQTPVE